MVDEGYEKKEDAEEKKKGREKESERTLQETKRGRFANFLGEEKLDYEI